MGLYDVVRIPAEFDLPKFPAEHSPAEIEWQTKQIGAPHLRTYKISSSGRLLRREQEFREKTSQEKQSEAEDHGFDSWEAYRTFCEDAEPRELLERGLSLGAPRDQTVAEEFWMDHSMHGTFEFHGSNDEIEDGLFWSYEAQFTRGDLEAIVFLGERGGSDPDAYKPEGPIRRQY
jgi:hypothetical protein